MKDWQSQTHVKWDCKYHVVIVPKYRQKVFFGKRRKQVGEILRDLCGQKEIGLLKGNAQVDPIPMLLSIPPKYSVAHTLGFLKGKSAIRIHRELMKTRGTLFGRGGFKSFVAEFARTQSQEFWEESELLRVQLQ